VEWNRIDAALDELLALAPEKRQAAIARLAGADASLRRELESLMPYVDGADQRLDRIAMDAVTLPDVPGRLASGQVVGSYRIVSLLGRGGMGEVYKAERVGVDFRQVVALKLLRSDRVGSLERFQAERQILAQLDHPGIARLLDGGVTPDGQPYMAMEFVDGHDLMSHCIAGQCSLAERLVLFEQICDAVAHAHLHLVVHRDLKPSNIFVTTEGRIKLLDFGIAKLLTPQVVGDATSTMHLSPAYAAPEQLTGGAVTTATDVYGLGATLYQLVCGQAPRALAQLPFAAALHQILNARLVPPSQAVQDGWPVSARQLQGDIDAIAAMALRREPELRYPSARALAEDISRHRRHEPVRARIGARSYVVRRFIRRHWRSLSVATVIFLLLVAGLAGITWQWVRAQREAQRATVTRNFLLSVFDASDPRTAQDKPRGQITARELLDAGSARIEREFAADPDLEIELLGDVAGIYRELGESDRYQALQRRALELAQTRHDTSASAVINALLEASSDAVTRADYAEALVQLQRADPLIKLAGLDGSVWRARYWLGLGQALIVDGARAAEREADLQRAVDLFAVLPSPEPGYVTALTELGNVHQADRRFDQAIANYRQAIGVAATVVNRNDAELSTIYSNLAQAQSNIGDFTAAEQSYEQSADIIRRTYGENDPHYWVPAADHARMVHLLGDRGRAAAMFGNLMKQLPPPTEKSHAAAEVRETYGACLAAEGQPLPAIALLETAKQGYIAAPEYDFELSRLGLTLGDAYARAGRAEDARRELMAALEARIASDSPDFQPLLAARERWGRFLLAQGDTAAAEAQFHEVLAQSHGHAWAHVALAQADLATLALLKGDSTIAVQEAADAAKLFDRVEGFRDVRMGPFIWTIYARALLAAGDRAKAQLWARKAVDANLRYDDPASADLAAARSLLSQIEGARAR
jgi:serine/threonine-protein kinase